MSNGLYLAVLFSVFSAAPALAQGRSLVANCWEEGAGPRGLGLHVQVFRVEYEGREARVEKWLSGSTRALGEFEVISTLPGVGTDPKGLLKSARRFNSMDNDFCLTIQRTAPSTDGTYDGVLELGLASERTKTRMTCQH